ncbi:GNAT family N-acetyltransferase [Frankia sp. CNm7]|uniref:GNAT family N-acetyltransferase n=1 Tax=Frankia nepalensis TaxID=1836974 RepID=A0A937UQ40_9ACTN|nr:GNAT family N-acetyltransferase [Frankia nepalensis]MBL7495734.1 GNAT family N-acetyltransferase [Frankia nepalensis]MBL7509008.1 GNAT family N-acetyltransferase [Frankia nepalensis]MBL7523687.1 GNAT family N-acetyltransferase [Frankia nepalensis]MBL7629807.1 GNAT family N-acetyltransferase [Frankia nepalensis]
MVVLSHPEPLFGDVLIRPAQPGDEDIVLDLLAEAAAWLRGRGIAQWPPRFSTSSVRGQIAAGEALLVEDVQCPVATLAIAEDDRQLWGADTEPAFYISRLAVARRASGANLGSCIIDWVAGKAAERDWQYVRLATASNNQALQRYYERAGFQHVADPPHARWPTSLYQRKVSSAQ